MQVHPLVAQGRVVVAGRMLAGLDQARLAIEAGLSPSTVSNVEQGHRLVRAQTYRTLVQALDRLGVDVNQNGRKGHHLVGTSYT